MATRVITGTLHHTSGAAWVGATVAFEMERGTFTISPDVTFPRDGATAITDSDGAFSVTLTSGLSVYWRCSLPDGDGFRFALADGSATTIEALRSASEGLPTPITSGADILITDGEEDDVLLHNGTQFINVNAGALINTDLAADLDSLYVHKGAFNDTGDLLVGASNDDYNNLPVGADGDVLVADSTEVGGVAWSSTLGTLTVGTLTVDDTNAVLTVDTEGASQTSAITLSDNGTEKWQFMKYTNNHLLVRNLADGGKVSIDLLTGFVLINPDGYDIDTRISGDNEQNLLYVDASADAVGIATSAPAGSKLDVNDDSIRVRTAKTPASASATGTQGEIAWDATHLYVCIATNTWRRVAHATW